MNIYLALTLLLMGFAVIVAVVAELKHAISGDGYGHRPSPRSLADNNETRSQTLSRLAH